MFKVNISNNLVDVVNMVTFGLNLNRMKQAKVLSLLTKLKVALSLKNTENLSKLVFVKHWMVVLLLVIQLLTSKLHFMMVAITMLTHLN